MTETFDSDHRVYPAWLAAGVALLCLLLLLFAVYHQTVRELAGLWSQLSGSYGHGYLVTGLALYLVYHDRQQLAGQIPKPSPWALTAIVAISLVWFLATLANVQAVQFISLYAISLSILWLILGVQLVRKLFFPLLLISFAFPFWSPLLPLLQGLATDAVYMIVRMMHLPVLRSDSSLVLPAGTLDIEESCSGLHYLLAGLALGTFYAGLNYKKTASRLLVIAVTAAAAILANIIRIVIIVYLAYRTDMQHPLVEDHLNLGWYIFSGLVFLLLMIDLVLNRSGILNGENRSGETPRVVRPSARQTSPVNRYTILAALAGVSILSASIFARHLAQSGDDEKQGIVVHFPEGQNGWTGPIPAPFDWMPVYHGAVEQRRGYSRNGSSVQVYVGYYAGQAQGAELISDMNVISNGNTWRRVYEQDQVIQMGDQPRLEQVLENTSAKKILVWYWYQVAGRPVIDPYKAKILQVLDMISGRKQAFVLAVGTDFQTDASSARRRLATFLEEMQSPLSELQVKESRKAIPGPLK